MTDPEDDLDIQLGYRLPELDWLRERAPAYDAIRRHLLTLVFAPSEAAFPIKYREMVAGLVAATRSSPTVEVHFRRALREGATMDELIEAVQIAERPGGATMLQFAVGALMRIESDKGPGGAPAKAAEGPR
jgi:alkylhydroperoxidase/carboxymuconolactone decarboxylase family protein YurZ